MPEYSAASLQNIDPEITLLEDGITFPANSTISFKLSDFIGTDEITVDETGNYFIDVSIPQTSEVIDVIPEFSIPQLFSDFNWHSDMGPWAGMNLPPLNAIVPAAIDISQKIDFEYKLLDEIKDIQRIDLDFPISFEITSSSSMAYLVEGFTIKFPSCFVVEKVSNDSWYDVIPEDGAYSVRIVRDTEISGKLACALNISRIEVTPGLIKDGTLSVSEKMLVNGVLGLKGPGVVPETAALNFHSNQGNIIVKGASIKVDAGISIPPKTLDLNLPPEISAEGNVFKFTDTGVDFIIDNNTPFPMCITGTAEAVRKEGAVPAPARFNLNIAADSGKSTIHMDESVCKGILGILDCLPDKIIIKDLYVRCTSEDFINIYADKTYDVGVSGQIHLPLVFAEGTHFQINYAFENKIDLGSVSLGKVGLKIELQNNLPVDIETSIKIDIDGQMVRIENEDKTPIKVVAEAVSDLFLVAGKPDGSAINSIGDIELSATASVNSGSAALNAENGLSIRIKSVSVSDGITLNLK